MRRRGWAAVAAVLVLGACGGSGEGESSGTGEEGSSPTSSPTTSTPTEPSVPLPDPTPTVEPATGDALEVDGIRIRAPKGWKQTYDTIFVDIAQGRDGSAQLSAAASEQLSLRAVERYFWNRGRKPEGYQSQDPLVVGGLTAYYYTAADRFDDKHAATLYDSGRVIKVEVRFDRELPDARQQELFASVLATYESPRTR